MSELIGPGEEAVEFNANNIPSEPIGEESAPLVMIQMGPEEAMASGGLDEKQIAALAFVRETFKPGSNPTKEFILINNGPRENGRDIPLRWDKYVKQG